MTIENTGDTDSREEPSRDVTDLCFNLLRLEMYFVIDKNLKEA